MTCAPATDAPRNGGVGSCSSPASYKQACVATCDVGFEAVGDLNRYCAANRSFTPLIGSCTGLLSYVLKGRSIYHRSNPQKHNQKGGVWVLRSHMIQGPDLQFLMLPFPRHKQSKFADSHHCQAFCQASKVACLSRKKMVYWFLFSSTNAPILEP